MNFELKGVSLRAGDKILLGTLSLDLPKGTTIGLIGHNGSGKSTLLKILANQVRPSEGRLLFQAKALPDWGRDQPIVFNGAHGPETLYLDLFYTPMYDADGHVGGVTCTIVDNSVRVSAEKTCGA